MSMIIMIEIRIVNTSTDLELLYYWRQNPHIYENFYLQKGPLNWDSHVEFWESTNQRIDWMILSNGRRIGSVYFKILDKKNLDIGIFLGDTSLWSKGIGSQAILLAIDWAKKSNYSRIYALVKKTNLGSLKMFSKLGFKSDDFYDDLNEELFIRLHLSIIID